MCLTSIYILIHTILQNVTQVTVHVVVPSVCFPLVSALNIIFVISTRVT